MEKWGNLHTVGVDIGSTTIKTFVLTPRGEPCFSDYTRHQGTIRKAFADQMTALGQKVDSPWFTLAITGSTGMGLSEQLGIPFVQEVVAAASAVRSRYPGTQALIDMGGEDSKLLFFNGNSKTDIRMNGNCAGGTGAFIDQMASLLGVSLSRLNDLAEACTHLYPVASRCGVFAKTDIQNLLSRGISKANIVGSLFHAIVLQVANTLMRGFTIKGNILFSGGPFAFFPMLRKAFVSHLHLDPSRAVVPEYPEFLSALGAAQHGRGQEWITGLEHLLERLQTPLRIHTLHKDASPLFDGPEHYQSWKKARFTPVRKVSGSPAQAEGWFLGIDSGSTTTKMVLVDRKGRLGPHDYRFNRGDALSAVKQGLQSLEKQLADMNGELRIIRSAVTGYGEDLIKAFFGIDAGVVETLAHVCAAREFNPRVSFILDMGGQDMKAVFMENGHIRTIEINEACSSGCGSFIQTFAQSLGYPVDEFGEMACGATSSTRLGSRCTVFMNSRVKQYLKDGASVSGISAGLACAVIDNAIHKVLKIRNMDDLGPTIVIQGGTFLNPSVHRAFEKRVGRPVICPDIAGFMGAYGAALLARDHADQHPAPPRRFYINGSGTSFEGLKRQSIQCKGCENTCTVTCLSKDNDDGRPSGTFYSGNKCERVFSNTGKSTVRGFNHIVFRYGRIFRPPQSTPHPALGRIGIPRVLNLHESFPFFSTLLSECGFEVVLSAPSHMGQFEQGAGSIMSDNICFPAKLVHGHIQDLIRQKVDRIIYPMVVYEALEGEEKNSYNCPIVSGYPDVIDSAVNPLEVHGIPLDKPALTFKDRGLLRKNCWAYLKRLGIKRQTFERAFHSALQTQKMVMDAIRVKAMERLLANEDAGRKMILLLGRPYHYDPLINHKLPDMICDYGMDVISSFPMNPEEPSPTLSGAQVFTQWAYTNRLYQAADLAGRFSCVEVVLVNSFGCGPDAIAVDELKDMLRSVGKNLTVIRVDEMVSSNSIRLRIRTLVAAGFERVPVIPIVVSVNAAHHRLMKHPVFKLNTMKLIENGFYYMLYCDVLSRMYYATVSRENTKGGIYVKFNSFSHRNMVRWLIGQGMEIDVPPLMYMVFQMLANKRINRVLNLTQPDSFWLLSPLFEHRAEQLVRQVDRLYRSFRFYKPFHTINQVMHPVP